MYVVHGEENGGFGGRLRGDEAFRKEGCSALMKRGWSVESERCEGPARWNAAGGHDRSRRCTGVGGGGVEGARGWEPAGQGGSGGLGGAMAGAAAWMRHRSKAPSFAHSVNYSI